MPREDTPPALLHKAMRYCVFPGGKRLRPVLCLAACEAVGGNPEDTLAPAAAIELLHTYTLVHDDLPCMDDDDLRRGKPTAHIAFGEANAVLAGDALQALAFEILASATVPRQYPVNQLVIELAHAAGSRGVVGGQVEDLAAGRNPEPDTLACIHLHKTADLFRTATRMGGIAAGASDTQLEALSEYGVNLGLAFQIADDLLDEMEVDGTNCVNVYGRDKVRKMAAEMTEVAINAIEHLDSRQAEPLTAIARFAIERGR